MKVKKFNEMENDLAITEGLDNLGVINIHIDGEGYFKQDIIRDIKKSIDKYKGEYHIFVDGVQLK